MLVLGIDPGTAICGYGFVEQNGSRLHAHAYGAVTTPSKMPVEQRLLKIHTVLDELIQKYRPDAMGVEQLLIERTPLQVKQSVTGYGKATKEQVIYMVTKLLHLPEAPHPDDTADALAVAISAAHCMDTIALRNRL